MDKNIYSCDKHNQVIVHQRTHMLSPYGNAALTFRYALYSLCARNTYSCATSGSGTLLLLGASQ